MNLTHATRYLAILMPLLLIAGSAAADIGLSLIALLFLIHSAIRKEWDWLKQSWVLASLAIWGYLNLRNVFAEDLHLAFKRSLPWIRYPLFAAALSFWLLKDHTTRHRLWKSLLATTAFLSLDGLLQYFTGTDLFGRTRITEAGYPRLTGPFSDPMLGILLVWISFPVIASAWKNYHPLTITLSLTIIATIFLSGERMAFLLLLFGLTLLLFAARRNIRLCLIGATLILGTGLFAIAPQTVTRQIDSVVENAQNIEQSPYGLIWKSALNITQKHPIFGIGSNQFRVICPDPAYGAGDPDFRCNQHPHQLYLEWLLDGGMIGLLLFLCLIGALTHTIWRTWKIHAVNPIFVGLVITLTLRLWPLATSGSFFTSWVAAPFWLMLGWLLAYCHLQKED